MGMWMGINREKGVWEEERAKRGEKKSQKKIENISDLFIVGG
jgi:hypothetical protein